jgi:hypothetical protein
MSDVRWEGYSHDEIYARVQQGPGRLASSDAEAAWSTVESTIRAVDAQLSRAVTQIGAGWQGRAADAVHGGLIVMSNWALDAAGDAALTRNGITAQAEQAARLRTAIPPPHTAEWNRMVHEEIPAVGLMSATGDLGALEERMANDHAVAVDMMNRYSSQSSDNQRMMNYWTQPPTVVVEATAAGPTTGGARVSEAVGAAGLLAVPAAARGSSAVPVTPRAPDAPGASPTDVGPSGAVDAAVHNGVPATVPSSSAGGPSTTGRTGSPGAATVPPQSAVGRPPAPNTPAGRRSLPGLRPGAGGLPSTSAPGVRPVVPGPPTPAGPTADWRTGLRTAPAEPPGGLPRPAAPGTGAVAEPAPRAAGITADGERAPASRTQGGHGFFPMGGAARPADQEHRRPSYLVDDTDAFADDRWFPPPVIGGDGA